MNEDVGKSGQVRMWDGEKYVWSDPPKNHLERRVEVLEEKHERLLTMLEQLTSMVKDITDLMKQ
jgi:hypothetical protein